MNHVSLRQSSGGSTAFSWNCNRRCVLVKRSVLFRVSGRGKKEDFRCDLSGIKLAALDFRRIFPECGRFRFHKVANDKPLQVGQRGTLQSSVRRADRRILSHDKETFQFAIGHIEPVTVFRMVAGDARQKLKSKFDFRRSRPLRTRL